MFVLYCSKEHLLGLQAHCMQVAGKKKDGYKLIKCYGMLVRRTIIRNLINVSIVAFGSKLFVYCVVNLYLLLNLLMKGCEFQLKICDYTQKKYHFILLRISYLSILC